MATLFDRQESRIFVSSSVMTSALLMSATAEEQEKSRILNREVRTRGQKLDPHQDEGRLETIFSVCWDEAISFVTGS